MTDGVVKFYAKDAAKDPDVVLERAIGEFQDVLIIGWDKEDKLDVRSNIGMTPKDYLWMVKSFEFRLLCGDYFPDE